MDFDAQYRLTPDVFGDGPEAVLAAFCRRIDVDKRVLDVGCGQGRHALYLARLGLGVDAVDPSSVACRTVDETAKRDGLDVRVFPSGLDDFDAAGLRYGAVLLFGLIPILDPAGVSRLGERLEEWPSAGAKVFITAFTTEDPKFSVIEREWERIGERSFRSGAGAVRTFLEPGGITTLFPGFEVAHHREYMGEPHHHGDGMMERHAVTEAVLRRAAATGGGQSGE